MRANSPAALPLQLPAPIAKHLRDAALCYGETQAAYAFRAHNIRQYLAYIGVGSALTVSIRGNIIQRTMPALNESFDELVTVRVGFAIAQRQAIDKAAEQLNVPIEGYLTNCLETYQTLTDTWPGSYETAVLHEDVEYPIMLRPKWPPELHAID